eukprot:312416-Rhodomonas_salina.1
MPKERGDMNPFRRERNSRKLGRDGEGKGVESGEAKERNGKRTDHSRKDEGEEMPAKGRKEET